ncbi:MAG: hypothetical protein COA63_014195 [Methylophaga sp.]|nr:hypothetical protein [Methylophaga sp.]
MRDLNTVDHHPAIEELVNILCDKTGNADRSFFRIEIAFFLAKMASSMRAVIVTQDRGEVPVNLYALALATSGFGKGYSVNLIESELIKGFKNRFLDNTLEIKSEENLTKLALQRSAKNGTTEDEERSKLDIEYRNAGVFAFTFDSGTAAALKQLRHKALLADCGALSLQIDEIGSNLLSSVEILNIFLELYDQGFVKQKITKNTAENIRSEELDGKTPANILLFGTPSKLLDGGPTEDQFFSFLDTGFARRCIFAWGNQESMYDGLTPEEIYDNLSKPQNKAIIDKWTKHFTSLADISKFGWKSIMNRPEGIILMEYKINCEAKTKLIPEHEEIRKAELAHRYYKVLKLAGALSFVDEDITITETNLYHAIKLVEESGEAFQKLLTREKTYTKLAKYIAATDGELTHADLLENLPFYKSGTGARNELMSLAKAWGYKEHIVIKTTFVDGIEFFTGESLKETDLNKMSLAYSNEFAYNYSPQLAPFDQLHKMTHTGSTDVLHWTNHTFLDEHRSNDNVIPGFNLVVIDVDGEVSLDTVHELLKEYKFMTYTTKRHTEENNRFRLILPINYNLKLDDKDYKEFMNNIMEWLPFKTDESANQRAKKWETYPQGTYFLNQGDKLLNALPFIPRTSKNATHNESMKKLQSLDNLERWFAQRIANGNRNNQMIKFALQLQETGMNYDEVKEKVFSFNAKLAEKLSRIELESTIMVTVAKKYD